MRRTATPFAVLTLLAALVSGAFAAPSPLASAMRALDLAVTHGDVDEMLVARGAFAALVADAPGVTRTQYGLAFADWRIVPMLGKDRDAQARKLCKEGIAACDRALAADPKFADALALKAGLQGMALAFAPGAAMTLGPEIVEENSRARGMAPSNPRVGLLSALSVMHQPQFVGGGPKAAKPEFERVIALYDAADDGPGDDLAWGRADAYLWSGRCLAALGDWAGAAARYRQVLALRPDHAWTKHVLLPEAENKLAAGAATGSAK
jgi:tetratricopeptide (TPR) repeat protein